MSKRRKVADVAIADREVLDIADSDEEVEEASASAYTNKRGGNTRSRNNDDEDDEYVEMDTSRPARSRKKSSGRAAAAAAAASSYDSDDEEDVYVDVLDDTEDMQGSTLASHDYSNLPLKSDHAQRPIWVCADGRVFLETYNPLHKQAQDFLIAIADPVTRPQFIHEYQISTYSLYAAASLGLETADIISGLQRLSKVALSQELCDFIREKTETCGKAKLLLKRTQYFVESIFPETLDALLRHPIIAAARIDNKPKPTAEELAAEAAKKAVVPTSTLYSEQLAAREPTKRNYTERVSLVPRAGTTAAAAAAAAALQAIEQLRDEATGYLISSGPQDGSILLPGTATATTGPRAANSKAAMGIDTTTLALTDELTPAKILSFEISPNSVEDVRRVCNEMNYGVLEEYEFRRDTVTPDLPISLRPIALIRDYQEKSLSKMFGNGRARSGIIVLPCGAGKTLVGITALTTIKKSTLILCNTGVSVEQWKGQVEKWSTLPPKYISCFTATNKERFQTDAIVVITTYNMVAFQGQRSAEAERAMDFITKQEWGLVILDEVHVAPAKMFRRCVSTTHSRCKLGLTATLVREDELIDDLFFLIGPKLYEANWLDLQNAGYIATVQCFPSTCTRVLTNHGFLFLDEIQALLASGEEVLYACYDVASSSYTYGPGKIVLHPGTHHKLVNFTQADERRRWSHDSDEYGECVTPPESGGDSNHLSLLVTADHDMYVQTGMVDDNGVESYSTHMSKKKAGELVPSCDCPADRTDCEHRRQVVRVLACAEKGIRIESTSSAATNELEFARVLKLKGEQEIDTFIELYGFWLGDGGSMSVSTTRPEVIFTPLKDSDHEFLDSHLTKVGLSSDEWSSPDPSSDVHCYRVTADRWCQYFTSKYGGLNFQKDPSEAYSCKSMKLSTTPPTSIVVAHTHDDVEEDVPNEKSTKLFWWWVLKCLDARQLHLLIDGLRRADGVNGGDPDHLTISTSSIQFRDDLIVALLHAGCSAYFECEYRVGAVRGFHRIDKRVYRPDEVVGREADFTPIIAPHDSWRVCYSLPTSPYGRAACSPSMASHTGVSAETYVGQVWCVQVEHSDRLIVAQRAERHDGRVTKASRPIIVGNCVEVWCDMTAEFYAAYLSATIHKQLLLYVMNPNKFRACEYLIRLHEAKGDKILVFSDNVYALKYYALALNKPYIYGGTTDQERIQFLHHFQTDSRMNTLFISKVGDTSIDLPDVNVIIQISSHFSSRRQEAQRLGRILRPKSAATGRYNAFFYSLVSRDTKEMLYSSKRQRFLVDQGYSFKVITELTDIANVHDLQFGTKQSQLEMLTRVLATEDTDGQEEMADGDPFAAQQIAKNKKLAASRRRGNAQALSGSNDRAYHEYEERRETAKAAQSKRHSLFRARQQQAKDDARRK